MKKLSICLLIIMCLFITGCGGSKEIVSLEDFGTVATDKGFVVYLQDYSNIDYINEARMAKVDGIEIEMLSYIDSKYAKQVQDEQIESFNLTKNTAAWEHKDKGSNYYRYELVSNGYYMINTRVDNTLIFSKTLVENKDKVLEIFNELGY